MGRSSHEQLVGRTIAGKFVVESLIGSGAMGAVFRARQVALEKTIAIKVLHGEHADDPAFAARFHREAKAASRLNHPNSMQVLDFGAEPDGLLYIAMEYLDGRSLHRVIREEGRLAPGRVADILMQTLAALAVAHDMGVVHRDLKPENIMVLRGTDDDGRPRDIVKVCDFGIAKITDSRAYRSGGERESNAPVTTAGFLVGTPEYMSPEQGRGDRLDARSDLYSLGVALYEMLTGCVPFRAESAIGVVLKHITEVPQRPSSMIAGVDARLEAICLRALRKSPDERHQSAREMRIELRPVAEGHAMGSTPDLSAAPLLATPPGLGHAATVQLPTAVAATLDEPSGKPTLQGTTSAVPRVPTRRRVVLATALVACVAGLLATGGVLVGMRAKSKVAAPAALPTSVPQTSIEPLPVPGAPIPDVEPAEAASHAAPGTHVPPHTSHAGLVSPGPPPAKSASAAAAAPGGSAAASVGPQPAPVTPPPAPAEAPPAPAPAATAAADSNFDPATAYVEVGLIDAQGVREAAVRGALHGVALSSCYRQALRARGARATGVAQLSLSIDENGVTRSAIATGAEFLPGLTRCVQAAVAGITVPKSRVDPGGGTADITLAFKTP
jgi:serine/threonine-protein kinase